MKNVDIQLKDGANVVQVNTITPEHGNWEKLQRQLRTLSEENWEEIYR